MELRLGSSVMAGAGAAMSASSTGTVSVPVVVLVVACGVTRCPSECGSSSGATWFGRYLSSSISAYAIASSVSANAANGLGVPIAAVGVTTDGCSFI